MQFDSAPPTGLDHHKWKTRIYEIENTDGMLPYDPRSKDERPRISTEVNDRTRTVLARAVVDNPDGALRANVFGRASVSVRDAPSAIAVPSEAVHWEGCCHVVFVRVADQIFQPRKVVVGVRQRGFTEIRIGLVAGEVVATRGSHVLKADVLKSRLGAGCADD